MYTSRRNFIRQGAVLLAATSFSTRSLFAANAGQELVGLQLYSVRDDMKSDPLGTLKQLSAMGYKHVEHANYNNRKFYGYGAKEFKKILSDLGMEMPSGHTVLGGKHWDATKKDLPIYGSIPSRMPRLRDSNLLSALPWRKNFGKPVMI